MSRLVSRLGVAGAATGIDRVERAWLDHLRDRPHLLLCRVGRGQALLPPDAGARLARWCDGDLDDLPGHVGWRDRLRGQVDIRARARAALAEMAVARSGSGAKALRASYLRHLPGGAAYLNTGHTNLTPALLAGLAGLKRVVMIHDTIPLDHPNFARARPAALFRARLMAALTGADLILTVSEATRADVERWRGRLGITRRVPIVAAPIGTRLVAPDDLAIPPDLDVTRPFFIALGTIEPRKNHALLLDAWAELARRLPVEKLPQLFIIGRRGWRNEDVFARLDALPADSPVVELNNLDDGAVAALMTRAHGLLMPSHAEGFGLPLTEAAARGLPVISTPLPAAREMLGAYARYLPGDDPRSWAGAIALLSAALPLRLAPAETVGWAQHFHTVSNAIARCH